MHQGSILGMLPYNMLLMIQQQIDKFDIKIKSIAQTKSAKTCNVTRPLKADGVMRRQSANFIRARINYQFDSLRCRTYERNLYL